MKKRVLSVLLVAAMVVTMLAGCGSKAEPAAPAAPEKEEEAAEEAAPAGETVNFTFATTGMTGSSELFYLEEFARLLEEKSGGTIVSTIYPDSQLGGDVETAESVLNGEITGVTLQPSSIVTFVPEFAAFDYPNLFAGYTKDQIASALAGEFFGKIQAASEKAGLKVMSFAQGASFRVMSSSKKIETINDFKGVKIRTMENPYHVAYWKSLGASPTPLAWSEVYLSLQQGVVDAQENGYEVVLTGALDEVQQYLINTNHILLVNVLVFSPAIYDSLTAEQQAWVDEAAAEAAAATNDVMEKASNEMRAQLEEKGMEILDLSDELLADMLAASTGVYDMISGDIGSEYLDAVQAGLGK